MELGEKLRQARLEAGLSQREVCGEEITRNMLSLIEHGNSRPSMATLQYLARRLGKPVSYFLDEDAAVSGNQRCMEQARSAYDKEAYSDVLQILEEFTLPDPVYQREKELLVIMAGLAAAEIAISEDRQKYARELLSQVEERISTAKYVLPGMKTKQLLLKARLKGERIQPLAERLPSMDEELYVRARAAVETGDLVMAGRLLDTTSDQQNPDWCMLRGEIYLQQGQFQEAAAWFLKAQDRYPRETALPLERCYRELGDYRQAYFYACKTREYMGKI